MNTKSKYNSEEYINKWFNNLYIYASDSRNINSEQSFICRCKCGNTTIKRVKHVVKGIAKACDICNSRDRSESKYNDKKYLDKQYGALKTIEFIAATDERNTEKAPSYLCQCQCGNIVIKKASHVIEGNVQSCGKCHDFRSKYSNKNFLNEHFGKLTVVGIGYNKRTTFICNCDCQRSNNAEYAASMIYNGYIKQCRLCAKESSLGALKTKRYPDEYLQTLIDKQFGKLTIKSIHKTANGVTIASCDCACGVTNHSVALCNILRENGTRACGKCRIAPNHKYDDKKYIGKTFGYLEVVDIEKQDGKVFWTCKCKLCNNVRKLIAHCVAYGNNKSCGCLQSYGEEVIEQALKKHKINYRKQVTFEGLKGIRGGTLRFDFGIYSKDNKLLGLIEYDGSQHFNNFNENYYITEFEIANNLNITKENDKIKNEYCLDHSIQLVRLHGTISENIFFNKMQDACREYSSTHEIVYR